MIGEIIAGLGLVNSLIQGNNARRDANRAAAKTESLTDRKLRLFELLQSIVENADKAGQFDPQTQINQLEKDTAKYEGLDLGNLAGALRVAGYRPGDSEIGTRLDAVKQKYRSELDTAREQIRRQSFIDKLNAYSAINPSLLDSSIQNSSNRESLARQQQANFNPINFLGSMMPYLEPRSSTTTTKSAAQAPDSKWSLPVSYNDPRNGMGFMLDPVSSGRRKPWELAVSYRGGR